MENAVDLQEPDESRPSKRVRLEAPLRVTEDVQDEMVDDDDWDNIYETSLHETAGPGTVDGLETDAVRTFPRSEPDVPDLDDHPSGAISTSEPQCGSAPVVADIENASSDMRQTGTEQGELYPGVPADVCAEGDDLVTEQITAASTDQPSARMLEEATQVENGASTEVAAPEIGEVDGAAQNHEKEPTTSLAGMHTHLESTPTSVKVSSAPEAALSNGNASEPLTKAAHDPEFLAAATAQKQDPNAEWQFDSSDAEPSADSESESSTGDSSSDSGSGSDDDYAMLDPATAARILMAADGDEDDGGKGKDKSGGDHQPRTANEVKEEVVPKPDVIVTEDMKITFLGVVDTTVGNEVLIKAVTPGEYQVLESGSVLCNEGREVIGAVVDTLGRVQEPIYSVAFTNAQEIEAAGLVYGTRTFYVDSHSRFVFTQPLKNLKGTDASNIHDEEIGEDELEFSDDEAEAEYKRQRKLAKRGGRGALSRSAFNEERAGRRPAATGMDKRQPFPSNSDIPQQQYGGGISYDDADVQEEFYSPLKRPDNLSELMAGGGPPKPQPGRFDRGRGRGRGRGDRGRGRGGFERRDQHGARGGYGQDGGARAGYKQPNAHRGNAHSFPDRHNDGRQSESSQHSLPARPTEPPSLPSPSQQYPAYHQQQAHEVSSPQSYQFNGYTFQHGNAPPPPPPAQSGYYSQQPAAHSPGGSLPAGSYVNPAFFQNQQLQQAQWSQPQPQPQPQQQQGAYGGWSQNHQQAPQQYPPLRSMPQHQAYGQPALSSQQQNNLADILRQFGGQQQQHRGT